MSKAVVESHIKLRLIEAATRETLADCSFNPTLTNAEDSLEFKRLTSGYTLCESALDESARNGAGHSV